MLNCFLLLFLSWSLTLSTFCTLSKWKKTLLSKYRNYVLHQFIWYPFTAASDLQTLRHGHFLKTQNRWQCGSYNTKSICFFVNHIGEITMYINGTSVNSNTYMSCIPTLFHQVKCLFRYFYRLDIIGFSKIKKITITSSSLSLVCDQDWLVWT